MALAGQSLVRWIRLTDSQWLQEASVWIVDWRHNDSALARALPQRPWFPLDAKPGLLCAFHVADLTILPLSVEP